MITLEQYTEWLDDPDRKPVNLVVVNGFDSDDNPITIRASDKRYTRGQYIYRSRLISMETIWELESGLFTENHTDTSIVQILNVDGRVDDWKEHRFVDYEMKRGDLTWNEEDFRTIFEGEIYDFQVNHDILDLAVAGKQNRVNINVKDGDFVFPGAGLPGTVAYTYLTQNLHYAGPEIDKATFDSVDVDYPYLVDVDIDPVSENLLSLVDRAFSGLPLDLCVRKDGTMYVAEFKKPAGSSTIRPFKPIDKPEIEIVYPLGQVTVKNTTSVDTHESLREDATIKADYPNQWRSMDVETEFVSLSRVTETETLGDDILALYDRPYDRTRFTTDRDLSLINLGDEIPIVFKRYGYDDIKYGVVTYMREQLNERSTVEAWV